MKTRPTAMSTAAARKTIPTGRSNASTAKAIASDKLAWSLGNDASVELDHGCRIACASYGRGLSHAECRTVFTTRATAAEVNALPAASFHLRVPPGRSRSQRAAVATTMNGMLAFSTSLKNVPSQWWCSESE